MQADMELERELRVQCLSQQEESKTLSIGNHKAYPPSDTHPPTKSHLFQKAIPPNSATSNGPTGATFIQTTTAGK